MSAYAPRGLEQVPLAEETEWPGDPNTPLSNIDALGIDPATYKYVSQGDIYEASSSAAISKIGSEGFVACSGFIMRTTKTQADTFSHFWPSVTDFKLEDHLDSQNESELKEAVVVYGGYSAGTGLEWGFANDRWSSIRTRAISAETGDTWWAAVFDRAAGDLLVLRRKPEQSMLRYHLFDAAGH